MILKVLFSPRKVLFSFLFALDVMKRGTLATAGKRHKKIFLIHPYFGNGVDESNVRWKNYAAYIAQCIFNNWEDIAIIVFSGPRILSGEYAGRTEGEMMLAAVLQCCQEKGYMIDFSNKVKLTPWQRECSSEADVREFVKQAVLSLSSETGVLNFDEYELYQICDTSHAYKCRDFLFITTGCLAVQYTMRVVSLKEEIIQYVFSTPMALLALAVPFFHFWKMGYRKYFQGIV